LGLVFNTSYVELRAKGYVHVVGAGPAEVQMPKTWGSHASRLTRYLLEGHGNPDIDRQVRLDREAIDRVVTWMDINAPYYPDYAGGAFRDNPFGRAPITDAELKRIKELTDPELPVGKQKRKPAREQIGLCNFTRPELSPCLAAFAGRNGPRYEEVLAILRAGRQRLAAHPRPDMPGFHLTDPTEIAQEEKYQIRCAETARMRAAAARGGKQYPEDKSSARSTQP